MKLIDNKGRIFGKLNIIDLIVGLTIIALVLGGAYMGYKVKKDAAANPKVVSELKITVLIDNVAPSVADALQKKDQKLVSNLDFIPGSISVPVGGVVPAVQYNISGTGETVNALHPVNKDVTVEITIRADKNATGYSIGVQEMRVGKRITVKTQEVECSGTVMSIQFND